MLPALLFADDIVLLAQSSKALRALLDILHEFLHEHSLTLSTDKTKWMLLRNGIAYRTASAESDNERANYGTQTLERVDMFKYLGLWFDPLGSLSVMTAKRVEAAKKSQGALTQHMIRAGWHDKWLRLLLHNIYVRTVLLYGCVVWGEYCVCMQEDRWCEDHTKKLGSLQRKALRAILGVNNDVRNEIVYVLACEWPLHAHIIKQMLRYLDGCREHKRLVTEIRDWGEQQDNDRLRAQLPLSKMMRLQEDVRSTENLYTQILVHIQRNLAEADKIRGS